MLLFFSCSVMCDSLWPHEPQHIRFPCPSLSPGVCSNSCPLSRWCHLTISSIVTPFFFCPSILPRIRVFSNVSASGGQSIAGASPSILPTNIWGWSPLGLTGSISLLPKRLSRVYSSTTLQRDEFSSSQPSLWSNSHICIWLLEKP